MIGAGSGGLSVAAAAAAFGVPVVLIEKGKMGGECLNAGCVPSKALIAAAKRAQAARRAGLFGVNAQDLRIDFGKVHDHVHGVIAAIAPNDSKERFTGLGVRVIEGAARFKNRRTVVVGDIEIRARRFVIATGSTPARPPIPGLGGIPHLTNETVFDLRECPEHLLVIGAGPIGLELAQAFRRLGCCGHGVRGGAAARQGRSGMRGDRARRARARGRRDSVRHQDRAHPARPAEGAGRARRRRRRGDDRRNPSAGCRRPATHRRGARSRGRRASNMGTAASPWTRGCGPATAASMRSATWSPAALQFTHFANYQAGLVIRNALFRQPVAVNADAIPWVTFTDPELAHVGLTEEAARKRGEVRVLRWPYHENDRAQAERETDRSHQGRDQQER